MVRIPETYRTASFIYDCIQNLWYKKSLIQNTSQANYKVWSHAIDNNIVHSV